MQLHKQEVVEANFNVYVRSYIVQRDLKWDTEIESDSTEKRRHLMA